MDAFSYLQAALNAEIGYAISTPEPSKLRTRLYAERQRQQKNGNYIFDEMSFFEVPPDSIWIVKHSALEQWRNAG